MAVFLFANNAKTTLAGPIASGATSLTLAAGTGTLFPNPTTGQQFAMTLTSQSSATQREIVYCTARSGDICTVVRGQEGTTPLAFIAGDFADNYLTAGTTAAFTQASQLQQQAGNYGVDTGTTNAIVVSLSPAPASLASIIGSPIRVKIAHNNTGACTLTVNSLPTTILTDINGSALASGVMRANGIAQIIYNGSNFQLISPDLLTGNNTWTGSSNSYSGTVAANGDISTNSFFHAGFGATGTNDPTVACTLRDFATDNASYTHLPNGWIIVFGTIPAITPGGEAVINYPTPFPNFVASLALGSAAVNGAGGTTLVPNIGWINTTKAGFIAVNGSATLSSGVSTYIAIGR